MVQQHPIVAALWRHCGGIMFPMHQLITAILAATVNNAYLSQLLVPAARAGLEPQLR